MSLYKLKFISIVAAMILAACGLHAQPIGSKNSTIIVLGKLRIDTTHASTNGTDSVLVKDNTGTIKVVAQSDISGTPLDTTGHWVYDVYKRADSFFYAKNGMEIFIGIDSAGTLIQLQTNGVDNGSQTLLNLQEGTNINLVDDGLGTVTITADTISSTHDTLTVNKNLKIPRTDTTNAISQCHNLIYDTILEHYFGDVCVNGVHAYWGCLDCGYNTVTQLNDSTYTICRQDGTCDTIQFTQGQTITGAPLTKTDDTNVTLTLGGSPSTALVNATSLTLGWTGVLSIARGGTNNGSLNVTNQNLIIADGTKLIGLAKGTSGQHLITNGSGNLQWVDTATAGSTYTANNGITLSGTTFQWRGTLNQNTTITGAGFYSAFNGGRLEAGQGAAVAAANDLTLGNDGNTFSITGATQINAITTTNWQAGSTVSLIFTSTPTVKHNTAGGAGTAVILLAGATDFIAAANDVLTLLYDGTSWHETARKQAGGIAATLGATRIGWGSASNTLTGNDSLTYSSTNRLITTTNSQAGATFSITNSTTIQGLNALILQNTAPSTVSITGTSSPLLLFGATAWKSNATAGSWQTYWGIGAVGVTGANAITSNLQFYAVNGNGVAPSALTWIASFFSSGVIMASTDFWAGTAATGSFKGGTFDATTTSGTSVNIIASNASNSEIVTKFASQETMNFYQATGNVSFQNRGTVPADVVDGGQFNIYQNSGMTGIGTVSGTGGTANLTVNTGKISKQAQIGDQIAIAAPNAETLTIQSITDDTHIVFTANMANTHTNAAYTITPATTRKIIAYNNGNLFAYGDFAIGNATFNVAGFMTYPAGTTLKAQAVFTAGTDLTTGVDGAVNWDGTEFQIWDGTTKEHFLISRAVNTVNPTAPNRTIKVTIGGTDYYIAAKTTND